MASLATLAAHQTGGAVDPSALKSGYALSISVSAGLFVVAAAVALALPSRLPAASSAATAEERLEVRPG
ncbi:hypothetical protein [Actinomadura meridiana]|uniref:hypothetical protein n=1 Tax=Actinomadura meridiana TaxID=559626 RepID=UPI0031E64927